MDFISNMFKGMFGARVRAAKVKVDSKVRRNTTGKVQQRMMNAQAGFDKKANAAIDGKGVKGKKVKVKKPKKPKGPKVKAPKMPKGGKGGGGGGGVAAGPAMAMQEMDVAVGPASPAGAPIPVSRTMQDQEEKTQAIDVSALLGEVDKRELVGWIVATNGTHNGWDFKLYDGKNVLGTAADCDMVVTDPYLSAKHCTIRHENGNFVLLDLDSTNGCFVNQKRITKAELIDNDTIRLGRTEFKFKSLY